MFCKTASGVRASHPDGGRPPLIGREDSTSFSAIVIAFSDPEATRKAIGSLLGQSHPPLEVLLVDNHPDAVTAVAMTAWPEDPRLRLIHRGKNMGYTAACNLAAAQ